MCVTVAVSCTVSSSWTVVIVTVCSLYQFEAVKVSDAGDTVTFGLSVRPLMVTVTSAVGWLVSNTS